MRIVMEDGRTYQGTALQVVRQMQEHSFIGRGTPVRQYADTVVEMAIRHEGKVLVVEGETDEQVAASLVSELVRSGLARDTPPPWRSP